MNVCGHLWRIIGNTGFLRRRKKTLGEKLSRFWDTMNGLRDMVAYTPVHQLILEVLERTGYGNHAKAMPDGAQRMQT